MQPKNQSVHICLKITFFIAISFSSFFSKAQDTDSVRIAINNVLAPLNKTLIPTGILAENSYPLLPQCLQLLVMGFTTNIKN